LAETEIFGYAPQSGISGANPKGSPGWFEQANGGTLFLDEVHGLSTSMQDQLLRVVQDRKVWRIGATAPVQVNVNVVAATDKDLGRAVEDGSFRGPLFFRFGARIHVPALRERVDDIPLLTYFFLDKYAQELHSRARTVSRGAMRVLMEYGWPGNVRQLENVIKAAVARNQEVIFSWDIQDQIQAPAPANKLVEAETTKARSTSDGAKHYEAQTMEEVEKAKIKEVLEVTRGNLTKAAGILGYKSRQTILNKMDRYGIPRKDAEPRPAD